MNLLRRIFLKIIFRTSLVLVIISLASIGHIYYRTKRATAVNILNYLKTRSLNDNGLFLTAKQNHETVIKAFLDTSTEYTKFPLDLTQQADLTWVSNRQKFNQPTDAGIYIGSPTPKLSKLQIQRLHKAKYLASHFGRAFHPYFPNLYFTFEGEQLVLYAPGFASGWIFATPPTLRFSDQSWYYIARPTHNPSRETRWTDPYFDPMAKKWMVSGATPIYLAEEFIGTVSCDVFIDDLLNRAIDEKFPGSYNYIVSDEGKVIAHPKFHGLINSNVDDLSVSEKTRAEINQHLRAIKESQPSQGVTTTETPSDIIAFFPISTTGWKLVTVYSKNQLWSTSFDSVMFLFLMTAFMILTEIIILIYVLKRELKTPMDLFVTSSQSVAQGNYPQIPEALSTRDDEIGSLAIEFNNMVAKVEERDRSLEAANSNLYAMVEARTAELEEQKILAVHSSRLSAIGEMAGGIAHEINTPLSVIRILCEQILEELKLESSNKKRMKEKTEQIDATAERVARIIKGLREFSHQDALHMVDFTTVADLIDDVKDLCQEKLRSHSISLTEVIETPQSKISVNKIQISQILINLINNSFDSLGPLQRKDKAIEIRQRIENGFLVIEVADNGPGIPTSLKEKIFQPFFTTKMVGKGTGLGLSISLSIAHKYDGRLEHETKDGWTIFRLTLPLEKRKKI